MPVFSEAVSTLKNQQKLVIPTIFSRPFSPPWNRIQRRFSAVLLLLALLLGLFTLPGRAFAEMVSISGEKVNLRAGPATTYPILWELGEGFPLIVLAKKRSWLKVKDFEGDVGWVYRRLTSNRPHLIVKKERVNIRKAPNSRSRLIGKANYGVVFATLKQHKGWAKVKHQSGLIGWIKRDLLWGW